MIQPKLGGEARRQIEQAQRWGCPTWIAALAVSAGGSAPGCGELLDQAGDIAISALGASSSGRPRFLGRWDVLDQGPFQRGQVSRVGLEHERPASCSPGTRWAGAQPPLAGRPDSQAPGLSGWRRTTSGSQNAILADSDWASSASSASAKCRRGGWKRPGWIASIARERGAGIVVGSPLGRRAAKQRRQSTPEYCACLALSAISFSSLAGLSPSSAGPSAAPGCLLGQVCVTL